MRKTTEYRDRAVSSPGTWSLLGGILGATAGAALGKRARQRRELSEAGDRWEPAVKTYEYGYASPSGYNPETSPYGASPVSGVEEYGVGVESGGWPGRGGESSEYSRTEQLKAKAEGAKERARETASELKHRASDKAEELKERVRGRSEELRERSHRARERIPELRGRATGAYRENVNQHPMALALGAICFGFAASFLLPVTQRERKLAAPTKGRVRQRLENIEDRLESRLGGESGRAPSAGYNAGASTGPSGGSWSAPSPSSAPYYGEDVGVVEDTSSSSESGRFFESSSDESSGGRTIH